MTQIQKLELPDELYTQIQGIALSQSHSVNEQIVTFLQRALEAEMQRQTQAKVLEEIHHTRWTPPPTVPDSIALLREIRGYGE